MYTLNKKGFSLIELITVSTVLLVLATIAYMSYSTYMISVRDSSKASQLKTFYTGLEQIKISSTLPLPDNKIDIKVNGKTIAYQGYMSPQIIGIIGYGGDGLDSVSGKYFSYYLTKDRQFFQLMAHYESEDGLLGSNIINSANALEYKDTTVGVYGNLLGILTNTDNIPVQEIDEYKTATFIDLGVENANDIFVAHIEDGRKYTHSGSVLSNKLLTISQPLKYGPPDNCREGFDSSWGDAEFNQYGFCAAMYEMTYSKDTIPLYPNTGPVDGLNLFNTVKYIDGKKISSRADYPIGEITYEQSKKACESLGIGYHLITNSEWLTLSRQIEFENENWEGGVSGSGHISVGNGDYRTLAAGGNGCIDNKLSDGSFAGPNGIDSYGNKSGLGFDSSCNKKRQFKLFNHFRIWDLSGNIWEYVDKETTSDVSVAISSADTEWNDSSINSNDRSKYGPLIVKNSLQGAGKITNGDGGVNNVMFRGSSYWDGEKSGLYSVDLGQGLAHVEGNVGFRCTK